MQFILQPGRLSFLGWRMQHRGCGEQSSENLECRIKTTDIWQQWMSSHFSRKDKRETRVFVKKYEKIRSETYIRSLKSTLTRSPGRTASTSVCEGRLKKVGFTSAHVLQLRHFCLHKNNAAAQSDKVAHNQGRPKTDGGFAEKWEKTKHKRRRTHQPWRFCYQICGECRKSCDSTQVSNRQSRRFLFFLDYSDRTWTIQLLGPWPK